VRPGDKVVLTIDAKETYEEFTWADKILVITKSARSSKEHPGYDSSMQGMPLHDLKTIDGEDVNCSLYSYELELAEED
jgi:hypothetical protein